MTRKLFILALVVSTLACTGLWIYSAVGTYGGRRVKGKVGFVPYRGWTTKFAMVPFESVNMSGRNGSLEVDMCWLSGTFNQSISQNDLSICGISYASGALARARFIRLAIPFWMLVVGSSFYPLLAFVRVQVHRHRQRKGRVCRCGYDLTGNESGICPECGREIVKRHRETVDSSAQKKLSPPAARMG